MEAQIYYLTLCIAIGVLVILTILLLTKRVNNNELYAPYKRECTYLASIFGLIALDFALSIFVNKYCLEGTRIDTVVDVACYTPIAIIFYWLASTLLDSRYDYRDNVVRDTTIWIVLTLLIVLTLFIENQTLLNTIFITVGVAWGIYIVSIGVRVYQKWNKMTKRMDNFYSVDFRYFIGHMRRSLMTFVFWGFISPLAAVAPRWFNAAYVGIGIFVFIYLFYALIRYKKAYEMTSHADQREKKRIELSYQIRKELSHALRAWSERKGYRTPGITLEQLAAELDVNQTALAQVVNRNYNCSFRDHVNRLRVRDAQEMLAHFPEKSESEIALILGFQDADEMNKYFLAIVHVTPKAWREGTLKFMDRQ